MKLLLSVALASFGGLAAVAITAPAASAIDCAKASTAVEKAICTSPRAQQADDDMVAAFSTLKQSLPSARQKVLVANQAAWIKTREACTSNDSGETETDATKVAACVLAETDGRRKYLAGLPAEGPGTPDKIVPVLQEGADGSFFTSLNFADAATPAEKLMNNTLNAEMKKFRLAKTADDIGDDFEVTLKYASPTLVSLAVFTDDESPSLAHPMRDGHVLNIDMQTGKALKMSDLLDKAGLAKVTDDCLGQLKDYLADTNDTIEGDQSEDLVRQDVATLSTWRFGSDAATLLFDPADSPPLGVCKIGYAELRPLANSRFPLPR